MGLPWIDSGVGPQNAKLQPTGPWTTQLGRGGWWGGARHDELQGPVRRTLSDECYLVSSYRRDVVNEATVILLLNERRPEVTSLGRRRNPVGLLSLTYGIGSNVVRTDGVNTPEGRRQFFERSEKKWMLLPNGV